MPEVVASAYIGMVERLFSCSQRIRGFRRYAVPRLQWLGVRSHMLAEAADDAWQPLTRRDAALIATLRSGALQVQLP